MKLTLALLLAGSLIASAAVPKPDHYLTDNSHLIPEARASAIDEKLAQFERDTSNQLLVYITPALPENENVDMYTTRLMHEWGVGQSGKSNGVGLFIFSDKKIAALRTGYGLEGVLPDAVCSKIRKETLNPLWKAGDYSGAIEQTTDRIIQTAKGEYKGTGSTASDVARQRTIIWALIIGGIVILVIIILISKFGSGSTDYGSGSGGGDYGSGSGGDSGFGGDCGGGGSSGGME